MSRLSDTKIAVVGLGYVGLPLALAFSKRYPVIGFDINLNRVQELKGGLDSTLEVSNSELVAAEDLSFSCNVDDIKSCNTFIVTVPTPIDKFKRPDLTPLLKASELLGSIIKKGDVIIYESTVYPGATEDDCIPLVENLSGLSLNKDFFAGYSPERINPGDKEHRVEDILKVTSGSDEATASFVDDLYSSVIKAGTFKASSIKVAEAAKVIENTQRDVNIALINELAMIFNRLDIDTLEVLEAAGTKWNFLPFRPGLVGGHCIGVDPYYLTHKAESAGYRPEMILAGRRLNDGMGSYVVTQLIKKMINQKIEISGSRVLVMGLTFKENCPDIRNTKVVDIVDELKAFEIHVDIMDPWCDPIQAADQYDLVVNKSADEGNYDAVILAVAHDEFKNMGIKSIKKFGKLKSIIYDLKYVLPKDDVDIRL
ncbi:Vi polysaccharide biosynthesis UDP-N-acetylglucosamine C-6 dehydrogenase TviB [Gammaproteobacteria bacterium]|nr:Vi polysaccharide biosynthesis UDP-N-acetylglucosamine C-6 dehydrogenase TviB [Gammaproteobacteria bacterium]